MKPRPTREIKKLLIANGFAKKRQNGSHATWKHKVTGHQMTIVEKGGGRDMSPGMVGEALKVIDDVQEELARRESGSPDEAWVDINEASSMLNVSHTTARTLRDRGELIGKKMRLGNNREKWFIETNSIRAYLAGADVDKELATAEAKVAALERERDAYKACAGTYNQELLSAREELEKVQEHRDQLQECLNNQPDLTTGLSPNTLEVLERLEKRLDSPEVRLLLGHGPTSQEVFEIVLAAGILSVQEQLDEPTSTTPTQ
ncbi:MAG: type II toxin-antitoxin system HicA family toxin [Planctomycetota bacterium]|jgi:predicted RNA binding protein YcfA (HicA-like mRNA interferase family)|nr:type II toxin-antitoxin system HicA family toxin [Planctomycetota bacterium]